MQQNQSMGGQASSRLTENLNTSLIDRRNNNPSMASLQDFNHQHLTNMNTSFNQSITRENSSFRKKKKELDEINSMDEIQELLKIFYKFFVGARNKPKPSNEENQPTYYKNKYYQSGNNGMTGNNGGLNPFADRTNEPQKILQ